MTGLADLLRMHIDYTAWASARLVTAASELTADELMHDFKTADKSVLGTLVHVFAADRLWLARLQAGPFPVEFVTEKDYHLEVLQKEWPALYGRWKTLAASVSDESATAELEFLDLRGRKWRQPRWQLMLHVVNHGTHHRGQVSGFLRALGRVPPVLDLVAYQREIGAAKMIEK